MVLARDARVERGAAARRARIRDVVDARAVARLQVLGAAVHFGATGDRRCGRQRRRALANGVDLLQRVALAKLLVARRAASKAAPGRVERRRF